MEATSEGGARHERRTRAREATRAPQHASGGAGAGEHDRLSGGRYDRSGRASTAGGGKTEHEPQAVAMDGEGQKGRIPLMGVTLEVAPEGSAFDADSEQGVLLLWTLRPGRLAGGGGFWREAHLLPWAVDGCSGVQTRARRGLCLSTIVGR